MSGGASGQEYERAFRRRLWRHNVACLFVGFVFLVASLVNMGMSFLFALTLWSMASGQHDWWDISILGWIFGASVTVCCFSWGSFRIKKRGSVDWQGILARGDHLSGVRIQNKMGLNWEGTGSGMGALFLMAPQWLLKAWRKWRSVVRLEEGEMATLERFQRNLAARESWEPVRHFFSYRREIEILAKMGLLVLREFEGEYHLRITLAGQGSATFRGKGWSTVRN